jgi:hypothetical protein
MENMTQSPLAPTKEMVSLDLPEVGAGARRFAYDVITKLEMAAYAVSTITLLAFVIVTAARHRREQARLDQVFAGLVLCASVVAFSFAIAVTDVLGFPILRYADQYNTLGYAPLSVLSAFGLVILFSWLQSTRVGERRTVSRADSLELDCQTAEPMHGS